MGETSLRVVERPHAFRTAKRGGRSPARGPGADCQGSGRRGGAARSAARARTRPAWTTTRGTRGAWPLTVRRRDAWRTKGNGNIVGTGVSAGAAGVDPPARQQPIMGRAFARVAIVLLPIAPVGRLPSAYRHPPFAVRHQRIAPAAKARSAFRVIRFAWIASRRFARSMLSRSAPCACVSGPARQGRDRRGRARMTGVRGDGSGRDIQPDAAAARIDPISSGGGREARTGGAARRATP